MSIISKYDAPHYWIRTRPVGSGRCVDLFIECRHGKVPIETLRNYEFQSVPAEDLKLFDIINVSHRGLSGGKPFFGYVTRTEFDLNTGTVGIEIERIESKIQPLSV